MLLALVFSSSFSFLLRSDTIPKTLPAAYIYILVYIYFRLRDKRSGVCFSCQLFQLFSPSFSSSSFWVKCMTAAAAAAAAVEDCNWYFSLCVSPMPWKKTETGKEEDLAASAAAAFELLLEHAGFFFWDPGYCFPSPPPFSVPVKAGFESMRINLLVCFLQPKYFHCFFLYRPCYTLTFLNAVCTLSHAHWVAGNRNANGAFFPTELTT